MELLFIWWTTMLISLFTSLFLGAPLAVDSQAVPVKVLEVERLDDGSILAVDSGTPVSGSNGDPGLVFSFRPDFTLTHTWVYDGRYPHSVDLMDDGKILITDTDKHRLVVLDRDGTITWDSDSVKPLSDGSTLFHPNDAEILPNGNILTCERNNHRVMEIDWNGQVIWQYGTTGVQGSGHNELANPHNAERLPNGNTMIADSLNNRVVEIDPGGNLVWEFSMPADPLDYPRDADELPDGTVLVTDSKGGRLVLVEKPATVLQIIELPDKLYEADLLPSGNYLVGGGVVYEVAPDGTILWTYPSAVGSIPGGTVLTPLVRNPTSGVDLSVHVHLPAAASVQDPRPAILRVPDGVEDGSGFHDECDAWAQLGFVAVHFDPDGRGLSTNGGTYAVEDYGGTIHQDGLREILAYVAGLPECDASQIAIVSDGYGLTMASGFLSRFPGDPAVRLLVDWEGQASRAESALVNGGFVPEPPTNQAFWSEREAVSFLPGVEACYVRFQTEFDPVGLPTHDHAIDLLNTALAGAFGGAGISANVHVNRVLENPPNQPCSLAEPPQWLPEELDLPLFRSFMVHNAVQRVFESPLCEVQGSPSPGSTVQIEIRGAAVDAGAAYTLAISEGSGPLPMQNGGWLNLDDDDVFRMTLRYGRLDAAARGSEEYSIPPNPGLSGRTYFAQAILDRPAEPIPYIASLPLPITIL